MSYDPPKFGSSNQDHIPTWKAPPMSHALPAELSDVEVWQPTPVQWEEYVDAGLRDLRITYDELAEQARTRSFQSSTAMNFWIVIGESED